MRRNILTAVGLMALALAAPSAALAHRGRGHHRHHKAHHAQIRFMHIGSAGTKVTASPNSATPTAPTPPAATPANAGAIASYTGGVLTLTLADGSTVSGKITEDTRIECVPQASSGPPSDTPGPPTDRGTGDDNGSGDDQSRGDMNEPGDKGSGAGQQDSQGGDDDEEEVKASAEPPCSSLLLAGTAVRAAELRIGPNGNEFENVLLVR